MFYPSSDVLQDLTERTKLIAQKCSSQSRAQQNAEARESTDANLPVKSTGQDAAKSIASPQTCNHSNKFSTGPDKCRLNCLCACGKKNLASLNRLIKNRCSFMSNGTFNPFTSFAQTSANTLPKRKPKKSSTKWYVKVNC
jgi:hypothetical protein